MVFYGAGSQNPYPFKSLRLVAFLIFVLLTSSGCGMQQEPVQDAAKPVTTTPEAVRQAQPPKPGSTLLLAQAQFIKETIPGSEEKKVVPGPARLVIWSFGTGGWSEEVVEDPDSNVFHKAAWFEPEEGQPGILTIGAQKAHLKIWRRSDSGQWTAKNL